ncbi:uncharacterized protein LOC127244441 [Andrographis paniculata]|uniref:uncharacterized protein LOC127244441 n=1 Tax=Andrographis paniculata TaxID=175694 RepID=UPI0021E8947F|nr:uncharacterized protein LOC127244441 [Andrographis paniculata]XP_051120950.1 uncharacterized protein LOC127244441 [Andrographis paniculata]
MKIARLYQFARACPAICGRTILLQCRWFQPDFVPRDPTAKPKRYKYPAFYDPYGPRPPPSDKIVQLAEKIASLPPEERMQIGSALQAKMSLPKLQRIDTEGLDVGAQAGARAGPAKTEEKAEKTTFDVKLEKFDAGVKLKVIKEIRSFTDLGLKEAKELVEKAPVILKQQVTKEEANSIIEKIKAVGGIAVME